MKRDDLTLVRDRASHAVCIEFERGRVPGTLEDGIEWERLGLGRVFFEDGRPIWYPDETRYR